MHVYTTFFKDFTTAIYETCIYISIPKCFNIHASMSIRCIYIAATIIPSLNSLEYNFWKQSTGYHYNIGNKAMANVRRINLYATNTKRHCDKGERGCGFLTRFWLWRHGGCCPVKKKQMRIWVSLIIRVI